MPTDDSVSTAIVVGDDRGAALKKVSTTLQKAGFVVVTAPSARAALDRCRVQHQFVDLAVIDTATPGINPPEIERQLQETYPHIRILFLSDDKSGTFSQIDSPGHLRRVLRKPYRRSRLLGRVLEMMEPGAVGA
jgi:CheY-like chemotaxis protein